MAEVTAGLCEVVTRSTASETGATTAEMAKAADVGPTKAADPSALVVFGGTWTNDYNFLESAYQAGARAAGWDIESLSATARRSAT